MLNPFNLDMTKMKTMSDSLNAELENTVIEGESGVGMVKAKVTGTGKLISIEVTDEVYAMGDKMMGPYGFYDAFSETAGWYPQRYLAIDQGPMAVMIENHRSGLLWKLFMSHPDVQRGLEKLGFTVKE